MTPRPYHKPIPNVIRVAVRKRRYSRTRTLKKTVQALTPREIRELRKRSYGLANLESSPRRQRAARKGASAPGMDQTKANPKRVALVAPTHIIEAPVIRRGKSLEIGRSVTVQNAKHSSRLDLARCKQRPEHSQGNGGSRSFIPWCKR